VANPTGLVECAYCGARYPEGEPYACCGEQHFFAVTREMLHADLRTSPYGNPDVAPITLTEALALIDRDADERKDAHRGSRA